VISSAHFWLGAAATVITDQPVRRNAQTMITVGDDLVLARANRAWLYDPPDHKLPALPLIHPLLPRLAVPLSII